jgi:hypothetical protein
MAADKIKFAYPVAITKVERHSFSLIQYFGHTRSLAGEISVIGC